MRLSFGYVAAIFSFVTGTFAFNPLVGRGSVTDECGDINGILKVPNEFLPGQFITLGLIDACLCVSTIPAFIDTNPLAIAAAALVGRAEATQILTEMINSCDNYQQCNYPSQSIPSCKTGSPCYFTCTDGYSPYPAGDYPTHCSCSPPYSECNGNCILGVCPSGYVKRDIPFWGRDVQCPHGLTACGVLGRSARAWECVDTMNDLESCGGCMISLNPNWSDALAVDCASLPGVSDVSCMNGGCVVRRCMPGFDIHPSGTSCVYSRGKEPVGLAAQYGLEHVPL